jgi:hypothetical protein
LASASPSFPGRLGLRLDRHLDNRLGEFHALQDNRLGDVAQRVAGGRFLQANQATMSPANASDFFAGVGVHLHHAADALGLALDRSSEPWSPVQ